MRQRHWPEVQFLLFYKMLLLFVGLCAALLLSQLAKSAEAQSFSSGQQKVRLLELYTSEGCSSCPPAEAWFADMLEHPGLWSDWVPMVFHVDYWNYLGWSDPLSDAAYSARQRDYRRSGAVRSVYTPGFVVDGREWRGWFSRTPLPALDDEAVGVLQATVAQGRIQARFAAGDTEPDGLVLNVALLGFDVTNRIPRGENRGKVLTHQFSVLAHSQTNSRSGRWELPLPEGRQSAQKLGLALWVTRPDSQQPLQATGGWLDTSSS